MILAETLAVIRSNANKLNLAKNTLTLIQIELCPSRELLMPLVSKYHRSVLHQLQPAYMDKLSFHFK